MRIYSNQLIYIPQSTPTVPPVTEYEVIRIGLDSNNNQTYTILGTVSDTSKSFSSQDESYATLAYVYEGNLYVGDTQITTSGAVTAYSGYYGSSYYMYYIESGKLMRLTYNTFATTQIGTDTTWTQVCGRTSSSTWLGRERAFGVNSNGLYFIAASDVTQISSISNWTKITGSGSTSSASTYGVGISEGKLYYLYANGNGAVQQGLDTTWTDISGYSDGARGINNNIAYSLGSSITSLGSTQVRKVTGQHGSTTSGFGTILGPETYGRVYISTSTSDSYNYIITQGALDCSGYGNSDLYTYQCGIVKQDGVHQTPYFTEPSVKGNFVYIGGTASSSGYIIAIREKYTAPTPTGTHAIYFIDNGVGSPVLFGYTNTPNDCFCGETAGPMTPRHFVIDKSKIYFTSGGNTTLVYTGSNITSVGSYAGGATRSWFVDNGKLYRIWNNNEPVQVGSDTDWVKVCGCSSTSDASTKYYGFAEKSDGLYSVMDTTVTKISSLTGWTKITGKCQNNTSNYGYGIHNGNLYYLYYNTVTQIGTDNTWTDICGFKDSGNTYNAGYGINNGALYHLTGTTPTQIGTDTTWTKVSGMYFSSSPVAYAMGLNNGALCRLGTSGSTTLSSSNWTNICGNAGGNTIAYGCTGFATYTNGLYYVEQSSFKKYLTGNITYANGCIMNNTYGKAITGMIIVQL